MQYTTRLPFRGDVPRALGVAVAALSALGFRIVEETDRSLELTGPGMNSTRDSALLGATRIRFGGSASELLVDAELGGVQRVTRLAAFFRWSCVSCWESCSWSSPA